MLLVKMPSSLGYEASVTLINLNEGQTNLLCPLCKHLEGNNGKRKSWYDQRIEITPTKAQRTQSLGLFGKKREIHKTTLTNPCNNLKHFHLAALTQPYKTTGNPCINFDKFL